MICKAYYAAARLLYDHCLLQKSLGFVGLPRDTCFKSRNRWRPISCYVLFCCALQHRNRVAIGTTHDDRKFSLLDMLGRPVNRHANAMQEFHDLCVLVLRFPRVNFKAASVQIKKGVRIGRCCTCASFSPPTPQNNKN